MGTDMSDLSNISNRIDRLFGTTLPIVQAPMAGVQDHRLAAAVSNAGGLGSLPCAMLTQQAMQHELEQLRSATTHPVNVNFFCHQPPVVDALATQRWLELLRPYFEELGVDSSTVPVASTRQPFTHETADILEPFHPAVVSFHFGLPKQSILDRVRGWGSAIISSATTVEEGRWLAHVGVDAIIAQGIEAGGHRGMFLKTTLDDQLPTADLVSALVRTIDLPIVAAGGVADASDIQNLLALGATAVQVGTSYLCTDEATTTALHREALGQEHTTTITNIFTGRPARGIANRLILELGPINAAAPPFPIAANAVTMLRTAAELNGSIDFSPLWAGTNSSGCRAVSAREMTQSLVESLM